MIVPVPRAEAGRQRVVAVTGSALLMFSLALTLRVTPLPAFESSGATIRQIDPLFIDRFAAPPPPVARAADAASEDRAMTDDAKSAEGSTLDPDVGAALAQLGARLGVGTEDGSGAISDPARREALGGGIGSSEGATAAPRFDELFGSGLETPVTAGRARTRSAVDASRRGGIEVSARVNEGDPLRSESRSRPTALDVAAEIPTGRARPRTDGALPNVAITAHEPEKFDALAADRLASWLRSHADELPVGVRVHLRHQPAFLTATAPFRSAGRTFELYLMYNQSLRELHILLVEGDQSVYLIERGTQKESRWLREGTVRRVDGDIVSVNSQARAATSARAQEFFSIFLSWWEVARKDASR